MFFFFFDYETNEIIKYCFNRYVKRCFEIKGYCDVSVLFSDNLSKKDIQNTVGIYSKEINMLYKKSFPNSKDDMYVVSDIYGDKLNYNILDAKESFAVLFWFFKIKVSKKIALRIFGKILFCFYICIHIIYVCVILWYKMYFLIKKVCSPL